MRIPQNTSCRSPVTRFPAALLLAMIATLPACKPGTINRGTTRSGENTPPPPDRRPPISARDAETPKSPPKSTPESTGRALATVNGVTIPMSRLHEILVEDFGLTPARNLIADEVILQELNRRDLREDVTTSELWDESVLALRQVFRFVTLPPKAKLAEMLDQFIATQTNLTRRGWNAAMTRNVRLGRLAKKRIEDIRESEIRKAYFYHYDGAVRVRIIQLPNYSEAIAAHKRLREGAGFKAMAQKYSTHPSKANGGLIPPVGMKSKPESIPPLLARVAREELKKPGDISEPVVCGSHIYLMKIEEIIPPKDVKYSEVKDQLLVYLRDIKKFRSRQEVMKRLIGKAQIEYVNPIIRAAVNKSEKRDTAHPTGNDGNNR